TAPPLRREDLGLGLNDLVLINVGTLEPRKNQIGLLDLFATLAAEHRDMRLLLVGDGPQRAELERKIKAMRFDDRVKLLGHRRDVSSLLKLSDLYVHYARVENCPFVLLEAARAGISSAAIAVGGIHELL